LFAPFQAPSLPVSLCTRSARQSPRTGFASRTRTASAGDLQIRQDRLGPMCERLHRSVLIPLSATCSPPSFSASPTGHERRGFLYQSQSRVMMIGRGAPIAHELKLAGTGSAQFPVGPRSDCRCGRSVCPWCGRGQPKIAPECLTAPIRGILEKVGSRNRPGFQFQQGSSWRPRESRTARAEDCAKRIMHMVTIPVPLHPAKRFRGLPISPSYLFPAPGK
jgi:hypothetical protein